MAVALSAVGLGFMETSSATYYTPNLGGCQEQPGLAIRLGAPVPVTRGQTAEVGGMGITCSEGERGLIGMRWETSRRLTERTQYNDNEPLKP